MNNFDKTYSKYNRCLHKKVKHLGFQQVGGGFEIELVNCLNPVCGTTLTRGKIRRIKSHAITR